MRGILLTAASISSLVIAASVAYFLLVYVPKRDRDAARLTSDREAQTLRLKLEDRCANQAKIAAGKFIAQFRQFGNRDTTTEGENHFNSNLQKCFVEVDSVGQNSAGGINTWVYLVNAFEGTTVLSCLSAVVPNKAERRQCFGADVGDPMSPDEADKRMKELMSQ